MTAEAGRAFTVDGETFLVREKGRGEYQFDWTSGPNPDYGFMTSIYPHGHMTDEQIVASIHDFLAEIDPKTGYLAD
ncbi:hypothetical protein [Brevibacterium yomogidense]|uniref:hypothetical protein n=1 Tax=Brevibacterium yomogidense TaxID=946573 RepID=UPI0018E04FFE|nr:hypothetical protein [Brevibacterium yomogidense]